MKRNYKIFFSAWISLSLILAIWFINPVDADEQDYYQRLKKSWNNIQRVYDRINKHYVEEIDPYPLTKAAIRGMLDKLDPYTVFIDEDGERRLQIITTGKYGGLGMEIALRNKNVTVISPFENSPAKRAGILAGDIIKKINGHDVSNWDLPRISSELRGKIGARITLELKRPGIEQTFELTLTRSEIVIEDVGYAAFIQPGIAYVSLTGFTDKAAGELRSTIKSLQKEDTIESFILDLRGNPGGLLEAAVDVVSLFVEEGELVVFTKGFREKEQKFHTHSDPILEDVPLAVLVDGGSASASEIVAGALQDLDRAVIIGEKTFGKGLVQKVFTIDDREDTKLKLTTAKYYVPSGRCIQEKDYAENNGAIIRDTLENDNEAHVYYTRNGRPVLDKGGIVPDEEVPGDSVTYVMLELIRNSMLFDFSVQYHQNHPNWQGPFVVHDSTMTAFETFLEKRNFKYEIEGSPEIKKLKKIADKNNYSEAVKQVIRELQGKLLAEQNNNFAENQLRIKKLLRLELAEKYYGQKKRTAYALETDAQAWKAVDILNDMNNYHKILAIK